MFRFLIICFFATCCINLSAQNVTLEYDNAGNRVKRLSSGPSNGCDCNLSLASSANATLNQATTLTATSSGTDWASFTYAWAGPNVGGSNINGNNISTTFNAPNSTGNHNYTVTASKAGCPTKTAVIALNVQPSEPNCNFNVTAGNSKSNPSPNEAIQLTSNCSGADCGGVSYAWSGNGVSSSSSTANINAPGSAGDHMVRI